MKGSIILVVSLIIFTPFVSSNERYPCPRIYYPVCGSNHVTYSNFCFEMKKTIESSEIRTKLKYVNIKFNTKYFVRSTRMFVNFFLLKKNITKKIY